MQLSPGKLIGMRRLSDSNGIFKMVAVDQRPPIKKPIADYLKVKEAPWNEVAKFKRMLVKSLQEQSSALLLDPHFAIPASLDLMDPRKGLVVTLEDSAFIETENGRVTKNIDNWSVAKIKRMGADAVKVLAWYRPDASKKIRDAQQEYVRRVGEQCANHDILFLFELLVYPLSTDTYQNKDYVEMKNKKAEHVLRSVEEFSKAEYGVDVFKLESPVSANMTSDDDIVLFREMGSLAQRPWVMLSAGAGKADFKKILELAFQAGCSGFLAGRAIWLDAFSFYPDWMQVENELKGASAGYLSEISKIANKKALPWHKQACYEGLGNLFSYQTSDFRHLYKESTRR
ncbi:MAG: tagatose 1,6-diphosphate aldolase [Pseudomonadota bacterium]|nr:tagatose 1,6-diphosphate aldolase [Pseudomonadota bacterium]